MIKEKAYEIFSHQYSKEELEEYHGKIQTVLQSFPDDEKKYVSSNLSEYLRINL